MYLFIYWMDARSKPRHEQRSVAEVDGGVAECSAVYRWAMSRVAKDPEYAHVENISMSTVPVWNGEVDDVFTEKDVLAFKEELGE